MRIPAFLLLAGMIMQAQVRVTLSMVDADVTKRIFGRWASSRQTMWSATVTNIGKAPALVNEAAIGAGMTEIRLRWSPYSTVELAMDERTRRHPGLMFSAMAEQSAFSALLLAATGLVAMNPQAAAGVGIGVKNLPLVGQWIKGATPRTLENLKTLAPWEQPVRLDPGFTRKATVWTTAYAPVDSTYVFDIPADRLPGSTLLGAVAKFAEAGMGWDEAAEAALALIGRRIRMNGDGTLSIVAGDR